MSLAAFFVQANPPALARGELVLDPHRDRRADPGEAVGHQPDQRSIAQAYERRDIDAIEQLAGFRRRQHRRLAALDHVLWPTYRMRRIDRDDLADDEPVKHHADRREMLLDGRLLEILAMRLDRGGDVQRLDIGDFADLVMVAPGDEPDAGVMIRHAGVLVANGGGEEFEETARSLVAGGGDHARYQDPVARGDRERLGLRNDDLSF